MDVQKHCSYFNLSIFFYYREVKKRIFLNHFKVAFYIKYLVLLVILFFLVLLLLSVLKLCYFFNSFFFFALIYFVWALSSWARFNSSVSGMSWREEWEDRCNNLCIWVWNRNLAKWAEPVLKCLKTDGARHCVTLDHDHPVALKLFPFPFWRHFAVYQHFEFVS